MANMLKQMLDIDGFAVIENFLFREECDELIEAANELSKNQDISDDKGVFSTTGKQQLSDDYFLTSNDKIRCFYEQDAFGEDKKLKVDPKLAVNKIGHALHLLHPLFRCYTYCDRVKSVCKELQFQEPAVVQSMFIYKNPGIGGEVVAHQDSTYLHTHPVPPVGFWIALEDADVQNGCLWIARGSHKSGVHQRLIRNPDKNGKDSLIYQKPAVYYPESSFSAVPVKKGTCILIHGNVVHKSAQNRSTAGRPAYTFHVIELKKNDYSKDNWLQEGPAAPFQNMYNTMQLF